MQKIKYTFADGTTSEIEVADELYALHLEIVQTERRLYWRESRRQTSLEYLTEQGIEFIDTAANPLETYIQNENTEHIEKAVAALSDKQQKLIRAVFIEGKTLTEIAKSENVTQPAITQRLATAIKKLKKLLQKTL